MFQFLTITMDQNSVETPLLVEKVETETGVPTAEFALLLETFLGELSDRKETSHIHLPRLQHRQAEGAPPKKEAPPLKRPLAKAKPRLDTGPEAEIEKPPPAVAVQIEEGEAQALVLPSLPQPRVEPPLEDTGKWVAVTKRAPVEMKTAGALPAKEEVPSFTPQCEKEALPGEQAIPSPSGDGYPEMGPPLPENEEVTSRPGPENLPLGKASKPILTAKKQPGEEVTAFHSPENNGVFKMQAQVIPKVIPASKEPEADLLVDLPKREVKVEMPQFVEAKPSPEINGPRGKMSLAAKPSADSEEPLQQAARPQAPAADTALKQEGEKTAPVTLGEGEKRTELPAATKSDRPAREESHAWGQQSLRPQARMQQAEALQKDADPVKVIDFRQAEEILPRLVRQIHSLVQAERSEVRIQLKPDHLGEMKIKIALERGLMTAEFVVESERVREIIAANLPDLQSALKEHGGQVSQMSVNIGTEQEHYRDNLAKKARPTSSQRRIAKLARANVENQATAVTTISSPWQQVDLRA